LSRGGASWNVGNGGVGGVLGDGASWVDWNSDNWLGWYWGASDGDDRGDDGWHASGDGDGAEDWLGWLLTLWLAGWVDGRNWLGWLLALWLASGVDRWNWLGWLLALGLAGWVCGRVCVASWVWGNDSLSRLHWADSGVRRDGLGGDVTDRAVGHGRSARGDSVDRGHVCGAGGIASLRADSGDGTKEGDHRVLHFG